MFPKLSPSWDEPAETRVDFPGWKTTGTTPPIQNLSKSRWTVLQSRTKRHDRLYLHTLGERKFSNCPSIRTTFSLFSPRAPWMLETSGVPNASCAALSPIHTYDNGRVKFEFYEWSVIKANKMLLSQNVLYCDDAKWYSACLRRDGV